MSIQAPTDAISTNGGFVGQFPIRLPLLVRKLESFSRLNLLLFQPPCCSNQLKPPMSKGQRSTFDPTSSNLAHEISHPVAPIAPTWPPSAWFCGPGIGRSAAVRRSRRWRSAAHSWLPRAAAANRSAAPGARTFRVGFSNGKDMEHIWKPHL